MAAAKAAMNNFRDIVFFRNFRPSCWPAPKLSLPMSIAVHRSIALRLCALGMLSPIAGALAGALAVNPDFTQSTIPMVFH